MKDTVPMQNKTQLSAEMEKRFEKIKHKKCDECGVMEPDYEAIKHFLATALEGQRAEGVAEERKYYCPIHNTEMEWYKLTSGGGGFDPVTKSVASSGEIISFIHETFKCTEKRCRSQVLIVKKSTKEALTTKEINHAEE